MFEAPVAIVGMITAAVGGALGIFGFIRSGRAEEARRRSEAAQKSADASAVGLQWMKAAVDLQQQTIDRQSIELGKVLADREECRRERDAMGVQMREQARQIDEQRDEIAELRAMMP